jgi:general secretion pathway protein F
LAEDAADSVRHGGSLSDALRRVPPLAESLPGLVQVGEASGNLARLLESAADRFQSRWDRFMTHTLRVLEPVLVILIGAFVLAVTFSVLVPLITMSKSLGG